MPVHVRPIVPEEGRTKRSVAIPFAVFFALVITVPALIQPGFERSGWFDRYDPTTAPTTAPTTVSPWHRRLAAAIAAGDTLSFWHDPVDTEVKVVGAAGEGRLRVADSIGDAGELIVGVADLPIATRLELVQALAARGEAEGQALAAYFGLWASSATDDADARARLRRAAEAHLEGAGADAESIRAAFTRRDRKIQELDFFRRLFEAEDVLEHISTFEDALAERSVVSTVAQPFTQWVQLRYLGQGNEKVVLGEDGWLFYRAGVESITGAAIGRSAAVRPSPRHPERRDPVEVIAAFRDDLAAIGAQLVVVPVPVKATIYPDRLPGGYDPVHGPPQNRGMADFMAALTARGVTVLDLAPVLWAARGDGDLEPLYLPLDSHWSPRGVDVFARALSAELRSRFSGLFPVGEPLYEAATIEISHRGDLFDMLKLPESAPTYAPVTVTASRIVLRDADELPVTSDPESPIVLLGDSATNIYSVAGMKWGTHAGLGEQLALHLNRSVHWIAMNGGGPSRTRRELARASVAGKTLVIWQFLARDLTHPEGQSRWEHVELKTPKVDPSALPSRLEVEAVITARTAPPRADAAELYPDTLIYTVYEIQKVIGHDGADYPIDEVLAVEWVRRDQEDLEAGDFQIGDVHTLTLVPFAAARAKEPFIAAANYVDDVGRSDLPRLWVEARR